MPVKRVSPDEALGLVEKDGYVYVDVRSIPEFEAGHPTGAYNVPWKHMDPGGMSDTDDFLAVMEKGLRQGREARARLQERRTVPAPRRRPCSRRASGTWWISARASWAGWVRRRPEPGWAPKGLAHEPGGGGGPRLRALALKGQVRAPKAILVGGGTGALGRALVARCPRGGIPGGRPLSLEAEWDELVPPPRSHSRLFGATADLGDPSADSGVRGRRGGLPGGLDGVASRRRRLRGRAPSRPPPATNGTA